MADSSVEMDLNLIPMISMGYRLQYEEAQEGWVMLYPEGMVKLNTSAAEILKRCDGKTSIKALVKDLEDAFDAKGLEDDVKSFLKIAVEQHWLSLG